MQGDVRIQEYIWIHYDTGEYRGIQGIQGDTGIQGVTEGYREYRGDTIH